MKNYNKFKHILINMVRDHILLKYKSDNGYQEF